MTSWAVKSTRIYLRLADIVKKLLRFDNSDQPSSAMDLLDHTEDLPGAIKNTDVNPSHRIIYYLAPGILILVIAALIYFQSEKETQTQPGAADSVDKRTAISSTDTIADKVVVATEPAHKAQTEPPARIPAISSGFLLVRSFPPSDLWIDEQAYGSLLSKGVFELAEGTHRMVLRRGVFPEYQKLIEITTGDTLNIEVRLDSLFGYYTCEAYPWGTVYLAGKHQGDTPILEPVRFPPGRYDIVIENPDFPLYHDSVTISRDETTRVRINLETLIP